ncbi:MAG: cation:proton antiporter [Gemmatimonadaceae bacterium]|nr:cation:proton antiporter [Gemmatimonadaceae bacterium]
MPHDVDLLLTVAAGLGLAFAFGLAAARFHLPTILGYLLAGVVVGPFTPGFVADGALASQLAEIGVILLMFGVGLHFSLDDLMEVRRIAIPGALAQIAAATGLGALVSVLWGWSWASGIVFGLSLSVASTVVLLRALEDRGALDSMDGRVAVGWLIVEDLVTVVTLVLLPALASSMDLGTGTAASSAAAHAAPAAGGGSVLTILGLTAIKLAGFLAVMLVGGRRVIPWLLRRVVNTGSRELFTLAVLAVALGLAVGAAMLFDVSFALGAFFAGVIVSESDFSHEAANNALPLQDAFAVLFFVSVGMLFDPSILLRKPLEVITVVLIILIGKSVAAFALVRLFGYTNHTALTISASLAQIGEFSFILAALSVSLGLLSIESQSLIVAGALLSITLNPFVFRAVDPMSRWLDERYPTRHTDKTAPPNAVEPVLTAVQAAVRRHTGEMLAAPAGHVVIIGSGRVGFPVVRELHAQNIPYRVIEASGDIAERLAAAGYHVVHGDATTLPALREAGLADARLVLVASPDAWQARTVLARAHQLNPGVEVLVRTHSDDERQFLEDMGAARALFAERELAVSMTREALERFLPSVDLPELTKRILRGEPIPPLPGTAETRAAV